MIKVRNQRYNEYLLGKRDWNSVYQPIPPPHCIKNPSLEPNTHFKDH
jgi:hypothetical protein